MKQAILVPVAGAALMLAGCGGDAPPPVANDTATVLGSAGMPAAPVPVDAMAASADSIALGLTERQLLDADFKDWAGVDLGDVEGIERDAGGTVTHLIVEIGDTDPDRYVRVPIDGLERVSDGDDWDVRGQYTRDQLMALPAVPEPR